MNGVEEGENGGAHSDELIIDENFMRLDTQFLKSLNKMEQIVEEQKAEHSESMREMQETM